MVWSGEFEIAMRWFPRFAAIPTCLVAASVLLAGDIGPSEIRFPEEIDLDQVEIRQLGHVIDQLLAAERTLSGDQRHVGPAGRAVLRKRLAAVSVRSLCGRDQSAVQVELLLQGAVQDRRDAEIQDQAIALHDTRV